MFQEQYYVLIDQNFIHFTDLILKNPRAVSAVITRQPIITRSGCFDTKQPHLKNNKKRQRLKSIYWTRVNNRNLNPSACCISKFIEGIQVSLWQSIWSLLCKICQDIAKDFARLALLGFHQYTCRYKCLVGTSFSWFWRKHQNI